MPLILGAQYLMPMKIKDEHRTTDAYCVAKYGHKWARTRTVLNSISPRCKAVSEQSCP